MAYLRDHLKDDKYWNDFIPSRTRLLNISINVLKKDNVAERHRKNSYCSIFRERTEILIGLYSMGEGKERMLECLPPTLDSLQQYRENVPEDFQQPSIYRYGLVLRVISIVILLDSPIYIANRIIELTDYLSDDRLADELLHSLGGNKNFSKHLMYPKEYQSLVDLLDAKPESRQSLIYKHLNKFYNTMKSDYWHNLHLVPNNSYFGYWSFETAAVVKILDIDDSAFQQNQYYPADLVHNNASV